MAGTLFLCMVLKKFSLITNNKPIFNQYNTFYNYEYFFFQSAFLFLFNHRQRTNQEQGSLCCNSPCFLVFLCTHYGPLQRFSTYFCKLKEIGALRPIFPDYVISCDYAINKNLLTHFVWYLETEKRYEVEPFSIEKVFKKEHFYQNIMQKMCTRG